MTITWLTYLIVCPLVFLGGFVDAIAGGGGLISLPAYMIAGLPPHYAIGTNKLSAAMGTTLATVRLGISGYIPWKPAIPCVIAALGGSTLGANIALLVSAHIFTLIMVVIIPITAFYVFRDRSMGEDPEPIPEVRMIIRAVIVAFIIGIYDGFYGPGTRTFLILLLSGFAHMKLAESNGIAKSINLATNIGSLVVFLTSGKTLIMLGVSLFMGKGSRIVKPIMIIVLALFFIKVITELV